VGRIAEEPGAVNGGIGGPEGARGGVGRGIG
jgi:hypothetical protein